MKIRKTISLSQIICILALNALIAGGLVLVTQSKFNQSVTAAGGSYIYRSTNNYSKKVPLPAITYSEFVSGSSSLGDGKTYYPQIKDSRKSYLGEVGAVREDCESNNVDLYLISDDGNMATDGYNKSNGSDAYYQAQTAMLYNTYVLQHAINCSTNYGQRGGEITLPSGTFYFINGHNNMLTEKERAEYYQTVLATGNDATKQKFLNRNDTNHPENYKKEQHIIKPQDNMFIKGHDTSEGGYNTTLKPFTDANYTASAAPDMFFFNGWSASNFTVKDYLKNNRYQDFIINGEKAIGTNYTSAGKGFMYNLFENTDWNNITVMNTDGTGFGVDAPINSVINRSKAQGCGKGLSDPTKSSGASGFGIGTGVADNESMEIINSQAIGNRLFGIFFEHQNRFISQESNKDNYNATKGSFKVTGNTSEANWYNYGGYRANDLVYGDNNKSIVSCKTLDRSLPGGRDDYLKNRACTKESVYIDDDSRNVSAAGVSTSMKSADSRTLYFEDVSESAYYYTAVNWAVNRGLIHATSTGALKGGQANQLLFGVGQITSRAQAVTFLWRYKNRAGNTVTDKSGNVIYTPNGAGAQNSQNEVSCFTDVPAGAYYSPAVKWAEALKITEGTKGCTADSGGTFMPNKSITRAEFITMLWRMDGRPKAPDDTRDFSDVKPTLDNGNKSWYYDAVRWAVSAGITNGAGGNKFMPDAECTREQLISMLCRYDGSCSVNDAIDVIKKTQDN